MQVPPVRMETASSSMEALSAAVMRDGLANSVTWVRIEFMQYLLRNALKTLVNLEHINSPVKLLSVIGMDWQTVQFGRGQRTKSST